MNEPRAGLVEAARAGDAHAFAALVRDTEQGVYNVAYGILGNAQEAQDMAQEAYLRAWRALPTFRGDSAFSTWLYRITVNTCLNRRRQLRAQWNLVDGEDLMEELPSPAPGPLALTVRRERDEYLWASVGELPVHYRIVVLLFYQQQMSYAQIAEVLSLPLGTVKARLNRARLALARSLAQVSEKSNAVL